MTESPCAQGRQRTYTRRFSSFSMLNVPSPLSVSLAVWAIRPFRDWIFPVGTPGSATATVKFQGEYDMSLASLWVAATVLFVLAMILIGGLWLLDLWRMSLNYNAERIDTKVCQRWATGSYASVSESPML